MRADRRSFLGALAGSVVFPWRQVATGSAGWRARVATVDITPRRPLWMAGFAARTSASQGIERPLHAKALALEDARGRRVVLVTLDLLGVTTGVGARIAEAARRRYGLSREQLLLNASHTHCGPVIDEMLAVAYDLSDAQWRDVREYTHELEDKVVRVIGAAMKRGEPVELRAAEGRATFAANRRVQFTPLGPVDHRVPVLRVEGRRGPLALVFGYACHNTTLRADFVRFHGDYAGVAQAELERRHPGATALFVAGCGGDANPDPRGTLDDVNRYGAALADAVEEAGAGDAIEGPLRAAYRTVDLPFAPPPDRGGWTARLEDPDPYVRRHARLMLERLDRDGHLQAVQPDPVQVWRFGSGLTLVAMGGEVVVDYALRLRRDYPGQRLWAAGYSNDVFGYVPSLRVLDEGGYEGGGAMIYYGKPGPFDASVEERIHATVRALMDEAGPGRSTACHIA
ncbi:MAG TPA: neutral/alkaline non-lysosomal ceramidase N-terminal domain-containing protein [Vicinamibacteria bacterium]|nr:neutral/alkaline non-lysosomal ceramidase N-terminal domain-containing protein [Vicinamibacteria bacterium]